MADKPLTEPQLRVLSAAERGDLYRSESIGTLYRSFDRSERHRDVTAIVRRLTGREPRLLQIGDGWNALTRRWLLTDAGRAELAKHDKEI